MMDTGWDLRAPVDASLAAQRHAGGEWRRGASLTCPRSGRHGGSHLESIGAPVTDIQYLNEGPVYQIYPAVDCQWTNQN